MFPLLSTCFYHEILLCFAGFCGKEPDLALSFRFPSFSVAVFICLMELSKDALRCTAWFAEVLDALAKGLLGF
uniref:Chitinase homolog LP6 (lp6) protein n=1 Tax=Pinus taeda TaxID=3352 RepID=V9GZW1_PINTA|nr:hypothetical protein b1 - loblolly pine [Pinus taeda]AAA75095.1 uORFb1; Method: conceptual translation supplied by author [Pinus taeda]